MTLDEFVDHVRSEPPVTFEQEVRVASPELLGGLQQTGWMRVTEWMNDPRQATERRVVREGHVLGTGASLEAIAAWRLRWPGRTLPADLVELLLRVNGIHLWADLETGRSYQGLAPFEEWELARAKMWGPDADAALLGDQYIALSYHADGAAFIVLNVDTGDYFLMDSCGADESCRIGRSTGELLDWLWSHRLPPAI